MTLRLRIARWLAPEWTQEYRENRAEIHALRTNLRDMRWDKDVASSALRSIIARATPGANATVRAMVKIAEEALNGGTK